MSLIAKADIFMMAKHNGQKRKLSGDPYWIHPKRVAAMAIELQCDKHFIAACLLHDVVEDCGVDIYTIETVFGEEVKKLVSGMTNTSKKDFPHLNRKARKEMDHKRLSTCDFYVKYLKFMDRYDNMSDMLDYALAHKIEEPLKDEGWFWLYIRETRELIDVIGLPKVRHYNLEQKVDDLENRMTLIEMAKNESIKR